MKIRILPALCAAAFLALFAGCNPRDTGNLAQDTKQLAQDTGQSLGNAKIAGSVVTVLSLRKGVDMSGIRVQAEGGTVTLNGTVRNREELHRVVQTVQNTRGVDKLINNLKVQ